tara:strand:- start:484 stop:1014 length:531 start_codon:yes stop_codon:yes gene_type:complete
LFLLTSKKKDFVVDHVISLLLSNTDYLTDDEQTSVFKKIYIENTTDNFKISTDEIKINLKKPIIYNHLHSNLFSLLSNTFFEFDNFIYYPMLQKIENQIINIKLTYTHSIILNNLLLNKLGLEKLDLYKILWPNDKNIQLNKLDTHLTNLKNLFEKEFNYNLNFFSKQSIIKLLIN